MGAVSQELTERAKLLISERRYQEAVRACRRALLSQPDQIDVRLLLGEALLALERYDEVRVEMMALARKVPKRAEVHRVLGEAYLRDGRPTQALESLRRALELDPSDEIAKELLGEAADENAPVSTTIERWFADEAAPTVETESPAWVEETTPVPGRLPQKDLEDTARSSPAAAPTHPAPIASMPTQVRGPRVRSRKPTAVGYEAAPLPPPPVRVPSPALPPLARPTPAAPPSAPPPEMPRALRVEATSAQRPSALRFPDPTTDELELVSGEQLLDDDLPGEPTRARDDVADAFAPMIDVPDELSGEPTRAQVVAARIEAPTSVHAPSQRAQAALTPPVGGFAGPPAPASAPFGGPPPSRPSARPAPMAPPPSAFAAPVEPPRAPSPSFAPPPKPPPPSAPVRSAPASAPPAPNAGAFAPPLAARPAPSPSRPRAPAAAPARSAEITTARVSHRRASWLLPAVIAGVSILAIGIVAILGIVAWIDASTMEGIREAARGAGDSGLRADVQAVIRQIDDEGDDEPELSALKARLLATLTLEHDDDHTAEVNGLIGTIDGDSIADQRIAAALIDLDRGDAGQALSRLSGLTAEGEQIAEAFRARALATAALGRLSEAEESARQAASLRPTAPRHIALHALMRHRIGDSSGALTILDGFAGADGAPAIRVVRARILQESGSDPARALEEASAVIDDLADRATPYQLAWAHLVRANHAISQGDAATALTEARAAGEHTPPVDEAFGMQLVSVLLASGAAQAANAQLAHLPEPPVDAPGRALLAAQVALAVGDLDAADAALAGAADGAQKSLLRGQVLEARGRPDQARPLYESAMAAPGPEGRRARVRLAAIALAGGDSARAITLLEPAHASAVDDLELVPLLVRAYLAENRVNDAQRAVDGALARRAGAAELLAARGAVQLRRGQVTEALASLREASRARPEDPDLSADLGEAARRAGELDAARAAFEAALAQRADHARALIGLGRLAIASGDLAQAEQRLEAAARTRRDALEVARVRGELLVMRGDGALGAAVMEPLAREHNDAEVWTALGLLQAQAEDDREAARSFSRAVRRDRSMPEAHLGESLLDVRRGDLGGARRAIETAAEEIQRRHSSAAVQAQLAVARARLAFENGAFDDAVRLANQAIAQDEHNGAAHLLIANVAIERSESPVEPLRRAVAGHAPPPEALGRLASRLPNGEEACQLARRYLQVAPHGYDASDVRDVVAGCR